MKLIPGDGQPPPQPKPVAEMRLIQLDNGQIQYQWPSQNPLLALSMLCNVQREILAQMAKEQQQPGKIIVPKVGVRLNGPLKG